MRIATYNVEWFAQLFDDDTLMRDEGWSARRDVTRAEQADALGLVFQAMNADAVMVIEAPDKSPRADTVSALEHFARVYGLRTNTALIGFANDTQQEIALLYDPQVLTARHDPQEDHVPRFDGTYKIDLDVDARRDKVVFSKPPLELAIETASGRTLRMIGVHLKSKAPHGAKSRDEAIRISIANRRKQLAQAIWLRKRIETHLAAGEPLIVLGDLNDGPGLDAYEHLFGRSSVEIVLGEDEGTRMFDPHASRALGQRLPAMPTTARFWIRDEKRYLQALLDYIMVSPDLAAKSPRWRIWHPLDDPDCWGRPDLRYALVTASDHFPVTLDIDL